VATRLKKHSPCGGFETRKNVNEFRNTLTVNIIKTVWRRGQYSNRLQVMALCLSSKLDIMPFWYERTGNTRKHWHALLYFAPDRILLCGVMKRMF